MMMMDAGEAAEHAASVAAAKPKERTKKEPKKPTTAPSAEANDPFHGAVVDAPDSGSAGPLFQDRRKWTYTKGEGGKLPAA